jgi:hypothetical protein
MHDLALIAAQQWAQAHVAKHSDPVEFGAKVAQAYLAAQIAKHHAGDELATSAALAVLSIPCEKLQAIVQLASHLTLSPELPSQGRPVDAAGAVE